MPWEIEPREGEFCIIAIDTGDTVTCHPTEAAALAHLAALYANVEDVTGASKAKAVDALQGALVALKRTARKDLALRHGGENVWYAKVLCVKTVDKQGDACSKAEADAVEERLRKDIGNGKVFEMGTNHEGEPTALLKGIEVERPVVDVELDGETFHKGDIVLKFMAFADRQDALISGLGRGVSLEGVEIPSREAVQPAPPLQPAVAVGGDKPAACQVAGIDQRALPFGAVIYVSNGTLRLGGGE